MNQLDFSSYVEQQDQQKTLILMRGISGSGKSTLAKKLHADLGGVIYSTDDFFVDPNSGEYLFDISKLSENHEKNKQRTAEAMRQGISPIIVDNTNTRIWEMAPYVRMADQYGYKTEIRMPDPVSFDTIMQRQKNRSGKSLSKDIVGKMLGNWEDATVDDIRSHKSYS